MVRFDPDTKNFKVIKLPGPMPTPYGFIVDDADSVWYTSTYTEVTGKVDTKTDKVTVYPSPYTERNTRDLFEDAQGRIWFGAQPYFRVGYFVVRKESDKPAGLAR